MVNDSQIAANDLYRMALDAALNCNWEKALEINLEIFKSDPTSTECLNRMAKAHFELGNYTQAKKVYQEVIDIDPYNTIAQKNLKKISSFKDSIKSGHSVPNGHSIVISPAMFLEEPGVTKAVSLVKLAEPQKLLTLSYGEVVNLIPKKRGISVYDQGENYLGALPDDSAFHLMKLLSGGNKYQVIIKSVKQNGLSIIIREIFRSKKFKNQASFLDESKPLAYSSDNITLGDNRGDDDGEGQSDTEDVVN